MEQVQALEEVGAALMILEVAVKDGQPKDQIVDAIGNIREAVREIRDGVAAHPVSTSCRCRASAS